MRYLVQAESGRKVGAIGTFGPVYAEVEAPGVDEAILEAYKQIEHLQGVTVRLLEEDHQNQAQAKG